MMPAARIRNLDNFESQRTQRTQRTKAGRGRREQAGIFVFFAFLVVNFVIPAANWRGAPLARALTLRIPRC